MTDLKTWQTLVERGERTTQRAEASARAARTQWTRAEERLERTTELLASARRPKARSGSEDFIQYQAYQQKLQQLRARIEREVFVLAEDLKVEELKLSEARETLRRYQTVLDRLKGKAARAAAQQEQKVMDSAALTRYLTARRNGDLAGGLS